VPRTWRIKENAVHYIVICNYDDNSNADNREFAVCDSLEQIRRVIRAYALSRGFVLDTVHDIAENSGISFAHGLGFIEWKPVEMNTLISAR
jgi:hypothetical protein